MPNTSEIRSESDALALRVFAGNGFGDATIGRSELQSLLSSGELYHLARAHLSYQLREIFSAALQAIGDFGRRAIIRWKHRQQARATFVALRELDPRILRDLGFHRSELMSVSAEVAGVTESTRARLVSGLKRPALATH